MKCNVKAYEDLNLIEYLIIEWINVLVSHLGSDASFIVRKLYLENLSTLSPCDNHITAK